MIALFTTIAPLPSIDRLFTFAVVKDDIKVSQKVIKEPPSHSNGMKDVASQNLVRCLRILIVAIMENQNTTRFEAFVNRMQELDRILDVFDHIGYHDGIELEVTTHDRF